MPASFDSSDAFPFPGLRESAPFDIDGDGSLQPSDPADRLGLFDALAPLVTDAFGTANRVEEALDDVRVRQHAKTADPFQALIADIAVQKSRESSDVNGERRRRALLRAIAELAETHAVAADLACETTMIDLPLDVPDPGPPSLPGGTLAASPLLIVPDMIRTCRDRLAAHATASDRTKLDIVATLFDHILADARLTTDVRNTLARLQLPVLRMALADDSFFESRTHPTRRLLDRLAASAAEWDPDTASGRTALAALQRVVHTVIRGSFEDAGEHARLLGQFERSIIDIATAASSSPIPPPTEPEDHDVLVIKTTIQISQLLAGVEVDRSIRFFLLDVWSRVLVAIALRHDDVARDALLARAKRLCFDLAWTTAPKGTSGERARLAGLLPTMIAAIRDGLRMIDYPEDDENRFFTEWTRVLVYAVRVSPGTGFRNSDRGIEGLTIDAFARRLRDGSFGPEMQVDTTAMRSAEPVIGLRAVEHATPSMLRATTLGAQPTANHSTPPAPAAPSPIVITEIRKGEWFEMREANRFIRVRLSWVSPLRSFYLFIGADSAVTRSLDPETLARIVAAGDLRRAAGRSSD